MIDNIQLNTVYRYLIESKVPKDSYFDIRELNSLIENQEDPEFNKANTWICRNDAALKMAKKLKNRKIKYYLKRDEEKGKTIVYTDINDRLKIEKIVFEIWYEMGAIKSLDKATLTSIYQKVYERRNLSEMEYLIFKQLCLEDDIPICSEKIGDKYNIYAPIEISKKIDEKLIDLLTVLSVQSKVQIEKDMQNIESLRKETIKKIEDGFIGVIDDKKGMQTILCDKLGISISDGDSLKYYERDSIEGKEALKAAINTMSLPVMMEYEEIKDIDGKSEILKLRDEKALEIEPMSKEVYTLDPPQLDKSIDEKDISEKDIGERNRTLDELNRIERYHESKSIIENTVRQDDSDVMDIDIDSMASSAAKGNISVYAAERMDNENDDVLEEETLVEEINKRWERYELDTDDNGILDIYEIYLTGMSIDLVQEDISERSIYLERDEGERERTLWDDDDEY